MKALLILSALLLSFNVAAERILLDQQWQPSDEPGEVMYYINQPPQQQNGVWPLQLFYLSTDKPFFTGSLNGPDLAGHYPVGDFEFFYDNGQLSRTGSSNANGSYHGTHRHYWEDGTLKGEYQYQNGQLNGEQKTYHQNGQLHRHEQRVNGEQSGLVQSFHANGQLQSRATYGANGMEALYETFYDNGKPEQRVNTVAGENQGERLYWVKEGWLVYQQHYLDGKLHGEERYYQAEGVLGSVKNYQYGILVGLQQQFSGPGLLAQQQSYDADGREIQRIDYHKNGNVSTQTDTQYLAEGSVSIEQRFTADAKLSYKYQRNTAKNWSLRESFNTDGELTAREEMLNDQYQGLYIAKAWNGDIKRLSYVNGKMHGDYREGSEDSNSFVRGQYQHGVKVGQWLNKTRDITLTEHFNQQGQLAGEQKEVTADGTVMRLEFYKNDKLHGDYLRRNFDGQIQAKGRYVNGQREGAWQLQDENSYRELKLWHGSFKGGREVGKWQAFSANGHLLGLMQYDEQGRIQGKVYSFNEDGSLFQSDEYVDHQLHGQSVLYASGEPFSVHVFEQGRLISD
jgi:antitoxin component YwqK of YwqJK toxin-antitoxin module